MRRKHEALNVHSLCLIHFVDQHKVSFCYNSHRHIGRTLLYVIEIKYEKNEEEKTDTPFTRIVFCYGKQKRIQVSHIHLTVDLSAVNSKTVRTKVDRTVCLCLVYDKHRPKQTCGNSII